MLLRNFLSPSTIDIQSFHHLPSELGSPLRSFSYGLRAQRTCLSSSRSLGRDGVGPPLSGSSVPASIRQPLRLAPCALLWTISSAVRSETSRCSHGCSRFSKAMGRPTPGPRQRRGTRGCALKASWEKASHFCGHGTPRRVAPSDATILLEGETGTGKELVARAVHDGSPRRIKAFVPINCGALPDHLVENELFGHMQGAYTDAATSETGLVAEAEEGTLFLDEVDTLSASAQVKLLRFLQDRTYRPVGSARSRTANVRLIAATNADLWQQVQAQRFREDLYYRLHVLAFRLPPLRERPDDIPGSWPTFCVTMARTMAVVLSISRRPPCAS